MSCEKNSIAVSCVLSQLSAHLDKMAGQILRVEEELGLLLASDDRERSFSISKVQLLDYVRQSLEDCALMTHILSDARIGKRIEAHTLAHLRAKLRLGSTQDLIKPYSRNAGAKDSSNGGTLDLF